MFFYFCNLYCYNNKIENYSKGQKSIRNFLNHHSKTAV